MDYLSNIMWDLYLSDTYAWRSLRTSTHIWKGITIFLFCLLDLQVRLWFWSQPCQAHRSRISLSCCWKTRRISCYMKIIAAPSYFALKVQPLLPEDGVHMVPLWNSIPHTFFCVEFTSNGFSFLVLYLHHCIDLYQLIYLFSYSVLV